MAEAASQPLVTEPRPPVHLVDVRVHKHAAVRDLAWVIGSPQIIRGRDDFPLYDEFDAACYQRNADWLYALDADPAPLTDFLLARRKTRLGDRFEGCIHFALAHCALRSGIVGPLHASVQIVERVAKSGALETVEPADDSPAVAMQVERVIAREDGDDMAKWIMRRYHARSRREQQRQARKVQRSREAVTVGEFDFVFGQRQGRPVPGCATGTRALRCESELDVHLRHVEVSVKYLLWSPTLTRSRGQTALAVEASTDDAAMRRGGDGMSEYHGPHRLESLSLKIRRGRSQMALYEHPQAQAWLQRVGGDLLTAAGMAPSGTAGHLPPIVPSYLLKGYLFYPVEHFTWAAATRTAGLPPHHVWSHECLSPALQGVLPTGISTPHMCGWFAEDIREVVARRPHSRWIILPKPFWLGPVVIPAPPGYDPHAAPAPRSDSTAAMAPEGFTFAKYAAQGSGLDLATGLDEKALDRVCTADQLVAAVDENQRVATELRVPRALRLLIAELEYVESWATEGEPSSGAWVEVSRGFALERDWALDDDATHEAKYGKEMDAYR